MGPTNHVLHQGQDRTNSFTVARGDKSAMRSFAKLLWRLIICGIIEIFTDFFASMNERNNYHNSVDDGQ